jgi:hypothetical protein
MTGRAAGLVLAAALVASGCAVVKLPSVTALQEQTPTQQRLDIMDCKAEAGYRTGYNGDDSPLANVIRHIFVVGTGGAALGGGGRPRRSPAMRSSRAGAPEALRVALWGSAGARASSGSGPRACRAAATPSLPPPRPSIKMRTPGPI